MVKTRPLRGDNRRNFLMSCASLSLLALTGCGGGGGGGGGNDGPLRPTTGSRYTARLLGATGSDGWIFPRAFNNRGQLAGYMRVSDAELRAFFFDGTQIHAIAAPQGLKVSPQALNDAGTVAGIYWGAGDRPRAFTWSRAGGFVADPFGGVTTTDSQALALNEAGAVGGTGTVTGPRQVGLVTLPGEAARNLFDAAGIVEVRDIDERNRVLGRTATGSVIWTASGSPVPIGPADQPLIATSLNERGEVAGVRRTASGGALPFVWTPDGGLRDLGTDASYQWVLTDINEEGQVAGYAMARSASERDRPFIADRGAALRFIDVPGGYHGRAIALNDGGQIAGYYTISGNDDRAFTWSAQRGFVDVTQNLRDAPAGLVVRNATAIDNEGRLAGISTQGAVLLTPAD